MAEEQNQQPVDKSSWIMNGEQAQAVRHRSPEANAFSCISDAVKMLQGVPFLVPVPAPWSGGGGGAG